MAIIYSIDLFFQIYIFLVLLIHASLSRHKWITIHINTWYIFFVHFLPFQLYITDLHCIYLLLSSPCSCSCSFSCPVLRSGGTSGSFCGSFSDSWSFMRLRLGVNFVLLVLPDDDTSYCFILGFTGSFDASGCKGSVRLHLGFSGSFRCWFTRCRLLRLGRMS